KAIAAASDRKAVLVVSVLSRFARCTKDAIDLAERLSAAGADLAVTQEKRQHPLADGPIRVHLVLRTGRTGTRADRRAYIDRHAKTSGQGTPHDPDGPVPLRLETGPVRPGAAG